MSSLLIKKLDIFFYIHLNKHLEVTEHIRNTIDRLPRGYILTYKDFDVDVNKKEVVIEALNHMVNSGKIEKLSKGKYFKPEKKTFGTLLPSQEQK